MENLKLANGVEMPLEGFGVFQISNPQECKNAVLEAKNILPLYCIKPAVPDCAVWRFFYIYNLS